MESDYAKTMPVQSFTLLMTGMSVETWAPAGHRKSPEYVLL